MFGLGLSITQLAARQRLIGLVDVLPQNAVAPSISGNAVDGTAWTLNVGEWSGSITGFDVAVVTVEATPATLLPRQSVAAASSDVSVSGAVGKSIKLRVWAKSPAGDTLAESASFGPVAAAGDIFVLGLAFAGPSPADSLKPTPYQWTHVLGTASSTARVVHGGTELSAATANYPIPNPNAGMGGLQFGFVGASVTIDSRGATGDPRLQGRLSSNVAWSIDVDLPSPGIYRAYAGMGGFGTSAAASNLRVYGLTPSSTGATVAHASGVGVRDMISSPEITSVAEWKAASGPEAGRYVEFEVFGPNPKLRIDRVSTAANLQCVAIFKKA